MSIDILKKCSIRLNRSLYKASIQALILLMVLARKINFTQIGLNFQNCEQRSRQYYEFNFNWIGINRPLIEMRVKTDLRQAISFDASFLNKSCTNTTYNSKCWTDCDDKEKRRLEILGGGFNDIDVDCRIMIVAKEIPNKASLLEFAKTYNHILAHWYPLPCLINIRKTFSRYLPMWLLIRGSPIRNYINPEGKYSLRQLLNFVTSLLWVIPTIASLPP